jgi:hypothetical protein
MNIKKLITGFVLCAAVFSTSAQTCYESSILSPSPFMGNNGEIFKLTDGSLWEVKYEYEYLYEYYPNVIICPTRGNLIINGKKLNVQMINAGSKGRTPTPAQGRGEIIESRIDGEFQGWEGETIFKLTNGQIWQQSTYAYTYTYKFMPKVMIIKTGRGYELQVEGMERRIGVSRLK